jgi:hypothetical protein
MIRIKPVTATVKPTNRKPHGASCPKIKKLLLKMKKYVKDPQKNQQNYGWYICGVKVKFSVVFI